MPRLATKNGSPVLIAVPLTSVEKPSEPRSAVSSMATPVPRTRHPTTRSTSCRRGRRRTWAAWQSGPGDMLAAVRLRIDLAYDGSAFHGWARQHGLRTVQGELEQALDTVLRTTGTSVTVAGRTDTGVHARGQVAHVDVDADAVVAAAGRSPEPPEDALVRRLNGVLDLDVRVHAVAEAADGFDARFSALWRRYAYRVADRAASVDPLTRGHVLAWPRALDEVAMNAAAALLVGEHD